MAVIPFNRYLGGLAEVPGSFANEALRAQAIAARSYALHAMRTRGQRWGHGRWDGCDCALYGTVRDQAFGGYAKEVGYYGSRWVAAVRGTGSLVVRYGDRVVQAFYSSSSGGYTSSNSQWGAARCPGSRAAPTTPTTGAALRNSGGSGPAEVRVRFGRPSDLGFAGDWNGNRTWTPGVLRAGAHWYLKDSFTGTAAKVALKKQTPGRPVVGDWDNRP